MSRVPELRFAIGARAKSDSSNRKGDFYRKVEKRESPTASIDFQWDWERGEGSAIGEGGRKSRFGNPEIVQTWKPETTSNTPMTTFPVPLSLATNGDE